ncbi:MAG TPA: Uma2 family endonuclease [Acetobacteraceae bacterium]|nr:Uma2 family endonuclease [Acetobacteraceae bacterium]
MRAIRRLAICTELGQQLRLPLRVRYGGVADDGGQTMDSVVTVVRPHRFTVAEYHRMAEVGILGEDSRVELIRGQIVDMAPIGAPHLGMVNRLTRVLPGVLAGRGILSVQNPVRLDNGSEPEPDVVVLRPRADDYATATPCPPDVLLLIEVADTSLVDDRAIKLPLYAENGIAECWIVNLIERVVEVCRQPRNDHFAEIRRVGPGEVLDVALVPGVALPFVELFPPIA